MKFNNKLSVSKLYKNKHVLLLFAFIITLVVYLFSSSSFLQETELKLLDYRFRMDPRPQAADSNVVMISIDDSSLDFFSSNGISWPWPRSFYGHMLDYLYQAKAVIFDMQFYEPDIDREETYAEETDGQFADAISRNQNVFLGCQLLPDSCYFSSDIYDFSLPVKMYNEYPFQTNFCGVRTPIPALLNSTKAIGIINSQPDRDGVIRRSKLIYRLQDHLFPQMSFSVWKELIYPDSEVTIKDKKIIFQNHQIPFDKNGDYLINWYGIKNKKRPFKSYPFRAIIASASAWLQGNEPILDPNLFKGKYVIIGATAAGLLDLKTNPYEKVMPGMEIWATQFSNFINQDFIQRLPDGINFLYTFIIIFTVFFVITNLIPQKANFISFSLLIFTFLLNLFLWRTDRILMNLLMPVIGFLISYLIINTVSYLLEGKSKRAIRKLFSRYLHEDVIKKLEEDPDQIHLGGEEIDATVIYTDIYDFTTISEDKLPSELVADLNMYFEKLIEFVFDHEGLLDKYTGDGIMVLFGAPISRKDHALLACRAANAHRLYRDELKKKTELTPTEQFHLGTRTGINSGRFVAGNIGGEKRMDYTAIGDTVNLAARLEGVNKIYQTNIIISENTYKHIQDEFLCRELDSLKVKGRNQPTRIYELICSYDEMTSKQKPEWIQKYEEALNLYRKGDWQSAGDIFEELCDHPVKDKPSEVLLTRCKYLLEFPPENWDGVMKLEVK
ncbi:MAG: adenylate/guanylate cyclase domain-containing protein [Candidatus Cloacimonetes bacterium]|nr:adenylate/guanylate cyclase domain-containing protein [Candidatus Cloacimonadota bacterium]MCF7813991.1 adenylate/guanylate cyclase domain-containing protein [Candidatus Cloacimonadota bacterium]MCF7868619.1 adenylate/guanylate cyclase domain-containing protein [Candidatus Cloacimonadota bacterium]MCF7882848.1 adenylate/guanylate cyclase domain-containing protein [Candidatus Cloacimonadota bacterium]